MRTDEFYKSVYEVVRQIPCGCVATYGQVAFLVGSPRGARMVGRAMKHAPADASLPCHRVVNSQGRLVPGWKEQRDLLEKEGVRLKENGCVSVKDYRWR